MHGAGECKQNVHCKAQKERDHLKDLDIGGKVWIGFIWWHTPVNTVMTLYAI